MEYDYDQSDDDILKLGPVPTTKSLAAKIKDGDKLNTDDIMELGPVPTTKSLAAKIKDGDKLDTDDIMELGPVPTTKSPTAATHSDQLSKEAKGEIEGNTEIKQSLLQELNEKFVKAKSDKEWNDWLARGDERRNATQMSSATTEEDHDVPTLKDSSNLASKDDEVMVAHMREHKPLQNTILGGDIGSSVWAMFQDNQRVVIGLAVAASVYLASELYNTMTDVEKFSDITPTPDGSIGI